MVGDIDLTSDAGQKGLLPSDVVVRADKRMLTSVEDLHRVVGALRAEKREAILLLVNRHAGRRRRVIGF